MGKLSGVFFLVYVKCETDFQVYVLLCEGVPKFYRFISERYPLINVKIQSGVVPAVDNLYLDMNGIIHNCARSSMGDGGIDTARYASNALGNRSDEDIFLDVFKYVDNLCALVRPRRLIYLAIDGVAPRAKMNQQRARRFRSAKEREDEHNKRMAEDPMYAAAAVEPFDSNCITPGTAFMQKLSTALAYYVNRRVTEDAAWSQIQVVLSGAEAPGEGEHKIMEYIRAIKLAGEMPPNTRHCVYGLDADLIMLGLVTHEPHFLLLREEVDFAAFWRKKGGPRVATKLDTNSFGKFQLLSIGLLREYLALDLGGDGNSELPFFDIERIVDDFVLILMLLGNDFLPNIPTIDISDGTLSVMLYLYKRLLPLLGGYLTESGNIVPSRFEFFVTKLGLLEPEAMKKKLREGSRKKGGRKRGNPIVNVNYDDLLNLPGISDGGALLPMQPSDIADEMKRCRTVTHGAENMQLKQQYYAEKFGASFVDNESEELDSLSQSYIEGIWWTLKYYFEGCGTWRWFFPHHYAPLASDLTDVARKLTVAQPHFVRDTPFKPQEQLLSVLPPVSSWCLPAPYRLLMTNPASPIYDQYPHDFETDLNGKRNDWEAVVLLPFVDESRLLAAMASVPSSELTETEIQRNSLGKSTVYRLALSGPETEVKSPFGDRLSNFMSRAAASELALPRIPAGAPFKPFVVPGTKPAGSDPMLSDLPTLSAVPHQSRFEAVGVNVFGMPSKSKSIVIIAGTRASRDKVKTAETGPVCVTEAAKSGFSVGSKVWVSYPWRVAGVVETVSDSVTTHRELRQNEDVDFTNQPAPTELIATNGNAFSRDASIITSSLLQKGGIEVEEPKVLIGVRVDSSLGSCTSQTLRSTTASDALVAAQYAAITVLARIAHPAMTESPLCSSKLMVGHTVLFIGTGHYFGHVAVVRDMPSVGLARVEFCVPIQAAKEPAFAYRVIIGSQTERYMTLPRLAHKVQISTRLLNAFLGSVRVKLSSGDEVDLGLGIKYTGRGLYIPGFACVERTSGSISFSEKAANLMRKYRAAFPDLFTAVEALQRSEGKGADGKGRGAPVYQSREVFSKMANADDAANAAAAWVSISEVATLPLVSTDADVLTEVIVAELEKHAGVALEVQWNYIRSLKHPGQIAMTRIVPVQQLVTGREPLEWNWRNGGRKLGPVPSTGAGLRLGDRVVNRMAFGGVPFGLRGTVVGIHHRGSSTSSSVDAQTAGSHGGEPGRTALVEVVFDVGFIGGGGLSGRCSPGRGKAVAASSLLILKPDLDNQYYAKHYASVLATHSTKLRQSQDTSRETQRRVAVAAVSNAALMSYADAARKKNTSKLVPAQMQPERALPLPSFVSKRSASKKASRDDSGRNDDSASKSSKRQLDQHLPGGSTSVDDADSLTERLKRVLGIDGRISEDSSASFENVPESRRPGSSNDLQCAPIGVTNDSQSTTGLGSNTSASIGEAVLCKDDSEFQAAWAALQEQSRGV